MTNPLLEVLTRHHHLRPNSLQNCVNSLQGFGPKGPWLHTILVDRVGIGVPGANAMLTAAAPLLVGEWIWILDDDDVCVRPELLGELKTFGRNPNTLVVMVRMDCTTHHVGVIPSQNSWGVQPSYTDVGMSCFLVRRPVYQASAGAFSVSSAADYSFINSVFNTVGGEHFVWHDVLAARTTKLGLGRPE